MKKIIVDGDLVTDHYLIKPPVLPWAYVESLPTAILDRQPGGAWFLTKLLQTVCRKLIEEGKCIVEGPVEGPDRPGVGNAYSVWAKFPRSRDDKTPVWRIEEFIGCQRPEPGAFAKLLPPNNPPRGAPIDLLVLEEMSLGFGDNVVAERMGLHPSRRIVLKLNTPPSHSRLFEHLASRCADDLVVVIAADQLRAQGAELSRGLSWDRTIEELVREFESGKSRYDLARCRRVVVYFSGGSAACSFTRGSLKIGPPKGRSGAGLAPCAVFERFLYRPDEVEGTWSAARKGRLFGAGSIITAAVALHELLGDEYPLYTALGRGLAAVRHHVDNGCTSNDLHGIEMILFWEKFEDKSQDTRGKQHSNAQIDPAFSYFTAYPHAVITDKRSQNQPASRSDLLADVTGPTIDYKAGKALQIVLDGPHKALAAVPKSSFGRYLTVDRQEIERINSVRALIENYQNNLKDGRPLSIAVFGEPGSGKSFAIKELATSLFGSSLTPLEFNLSQFERGMSQLHTAFHQVRDTSIKGAMPLVFWDEFDADDLFWLQHFLAPMQDTEFRSGSLVHRIGRAIFVFAGGTEHTFDAFVANGRKRKDFKAKKGPDFVSRLRGYIDIKGPNPRDGKPQADPAYVIRRAVLLRSALEELAGPLIDAGGRAAISTGVVRGFLRATRFEHGARSIKAVLSMSLLDGGRWFGPASLPPPEFLAMHVSEDFLDEVRQGELDAEVLEKLAAAIHNAWVPSKRERGYRHPSEAPEGFDEKMIDERLCPYHELREEHKEANREPVRYVAARLHDCNYQVDGAAAARAGEHPPLPQNVFEKLIALEHDNWTRKQMICGYQWAEKTDNLRRLHEDVAVFADVKREHQVYDRDIVTAVLNTLWSNGYHARPMKKKPRAAQPSDGAATNSRPRGAKRRRNVRQR